MRKLKKLVLMIMVVLLLLSNNMMAVSSLQEIVKVNFNSINLSLNGYEAGVKDSNYRLSNGDWVPFSMVYKGTTYLPLRKISEILDVKVGWDNTSRTIMLQSNEKSETVKPKEVNENGIIHIDEMQYNKLQFNVETDKIQAVSLFYDGQYHDANYKLNDEMLTISNSISIGENATIRIFTEKGETVYQVNNTILPTLESAKKATYEELEYIVLPPNPDEGFYFPMLLCVGNGNDVRMKTEKKHLFVDILNVEQMKSKEDFDSLNYDDAIGSAGLGHMMAVWLEMPFILPLIPKLNIEFSTEETGRVYTYESAFDRDTIFYKEILSGEMYGPSVAKEVREQIVERGFKPEAFIDIDEQLIKMIKFANEYLRKYGYNMEDKVFMNGFSASGTFVDRFATMHPEIVRAYAGLAAGDSFVLPIDKLEGHNLILPLGVSDYQKATGRTFSLKDYNSVARILQMGEKDTNDVMKYRSCFGKDELEIAYDLWGETTLERAYDLYDDFSMTGGHGLLIIDKDIEHGTSFEMKKYLLDFYYANIGDDTSITYPEISTNQLEYYLYN